ncbi:ParA family protein [Streptomyces pinistramenti]|uniref:ParA family protein n=1 Tax=Streptomyces pinistramenti TaxID=2884812 RepID=UPI001D08014B|nr:ParA family protein [Streptomyces pinistramenti]MCB5910370.1 ParA family protein [Streptomyces pinistramenti]
MTTTGLPAADWLRYGPLPFAERGMTRIIVMCNQKGGVGKTTTTINLAGSLASFGLRVLIVDGDPSGNATDAYKIEMLDEDEGDTQVTCLLGGKDPHPLVARPFENIHLLPASMDMQFLPARLRERGNALHTHRKMLARFQGEYDYILLDTRPAIDTDTDSMTAASDGAITMVDVDRWAMKAVNMQLAQHEMIMEELERQDFTELGLVISTAKGGSGRFDAAVLNNLRKHPDLANLGEVPYRGADLKEARAMGQPVQMYRPKSDTAGFFRDIAVKSGMVQAA